MAKPMMVFVTMNATHSLAAGTAVTALWQLTPGLVAQSLTAGMSSTTASVMSPATMLIVCMTTLIAKTRRKFASEFTFTVHTVPVSFLSVLL